MSCGIFRKPCQQVLVTSHWQGATRGDDEDQSLFVFQSIFIFAPPPLSLSAQTITPVIMIILIPRATTAIIIIIKRKVVIIITVVFAVIWKKEQIHDNDNNSKIRMSKNEDYDNVHMHEEGN